MSETVIAAESSDFLGEDLDPTRRCGESVLRGIAPIVVI
jgi:hypothetical protein